MKSSLRQRCLWGAWLALAVFVAVVATAPAAEARAHHSDAWAREHFANAERMREALNGTPAADRTRHDYQRVLNAYRSVYLGAPSSSKADPSVVAVAETLVEMGRHFDDDKILNEAVEQYKFLRREYPGSKYRFDGLFTIGEIYKDDLNDADAARSTFQEFLRRYPHNRLADDARQAITELKQQARAEKVAAAQKAAEAKPQEKSGNTKDAKDGGDGSISIAESGVDKSSEPHSGRLPRVTGIRHWSTPDYTRVAIDLESDVKYSSQRLDGPARIFFDLRDTKLASTLVGKSFDVDDGFLKKVRVAQFAPGRTRVVLEVDNLSDYDAFLLPNPYRLIIDIHGRNGRAKQIKADDAGEVASAPGESAAPSKTLQKSVSADVSSDTQTSDAIASKKPPTTVVKKIVEADDDDPEPSAPSAGATRRKAVSAKRVAAGDLDGESDSSDATVSAVPNNPGGSGPKSGVRTLASGRSGSGSGLDIREAKPTAGGDRSLIRALGLKIGKIVIDPGHGGHDTGTIGPNGLEEKDLVLDVGRRLGKLLETRLGAEVVYTRKDDTFIPLETRTAIANQARADLFVSIHANSSHDPDARGVETYYLNFTSSPEALEVAARENAVSEKSIYELQDLVKKIALKEKIEESREFAGDVEQSLHSGLAAKSPGIRDRGVKKAPFIVLIGANMPSILAEVSFVSNPTDEHHLETSEYRQRIAESLYRGIANYVNGLSGVKVASKMDKAAGQ
ncbi:MAG: N-acetylmuramoyl-L-alanine amidase [Candidatus Sulfotelmatobacter sp.]